MASKVKNQRVKKLKLSNDLLLSMLEKMLLIRVFEMNVSKLWKANQIRGPVHTYIGQEAVGAGVCTALRPDDYIVSHHRGHGHCIAKGADLRKMMAELFGKKDGYCRGRGGSMHICAFEVGMLGACGIVGAGIPISVGAALSAKMRKSGQVSVSFFGDGASNQGVCHEAMNLAAVGKLPVIFVCENNLYAISTHHSKASAITDIADRADSYGMPGMIVDGMDVVAVYEATLDAAARARRGEGPTLIECKTYRFEGHFVADEGFYRGQDEVKRWLERCPIKQFKGLLLDGKVIAPEDIEAMEKKAEAAVKEAIDFANKSPEPPDDYLYYGLYADPMTKY